MGRGRRRPGRRAPGRRRLDFCRHYLESARRYRPHLLSEPEERILSDKALTANSAWVRLFSELTSAIAVDLDGKSVSLEEGLSRLMSPDRGRASERRRRGHRRVGAGPAHARVRVQHAARRQVGRRPPAPLPELDRRPQPRQRGERRVGAGAGRRGAGALRHPATVVRAEGAAARPAAPRRLRPHGVGGVGQTRSSAGPKRASWCSTRTRRSRPIWRRSRSRFFDESWIDAPVRPGKRGGAFCAYTVPSQHPYLLLNWTARRRDVLTLAHEMGHGLHAYLARAGHLPPDHAAHARGDRVGVRRDGHLRAAPRRHR